MELQTDKLVKLSTYAKMVNKSRSWIYKAVESGTVRAIDIDGVKFILL